MGLDINPYIELNEGRGDRYDLFAEIVIGRNGNLFELISGNQRFHAGDSQPLFPDRGLPSDLSLILQEDYEECGDDACNPSWLTADELCQVRKSLPESLTAQYLDAVVAAKKTLKFTTKGTSRFVFWFS